MVFTMKAINKTVLWNFLLFFCTAFVFFVRWYMLNKSPEPTGLDGYYYALQAKSFMQYGILENPDYKIGYYLCGISSLLCGDPIIGCKIIAALMSALLCLGVYAVLRSLKIPHMSSLTGFFLCGSSFAVASMATNYINNLTGIVFFLFYAALLIRLCYEDATSSKIGSILKITLAALLFLCCVLSHLVSAAFAFLFTIILFLRKQSFRHQIAFLIVSIVAGILIFSRQLPRFTSVFSLGPILPVLSDSMRKAVGMRISGEMSVLFITAWLLCIFRTLQCVRKKYLDLSVFAAPILFFPFWNLDILDMGYRMLLSAVPIGIIMLVLGINNMLKQSERNRHIFFSIILCVTVPGTVVSVYSYNPFNDPPFSYYRRIVQDIELPDDSLLIAHLGLNHVYTYYKNLRDCLNYEPDFPVPPEKLWRIAYGVHIISLENQLTDLRQEDFSRYIQPIDSYYTLIREDIWQRYLENEEESIAATYNNWFNPHTVRPQFIRKNK